MNFVLPDIVDLGDIMVPPIVIEGKKEISSSKLIFGSELYVPYSGGLGIAFMVLAAICIAGTVVCNAHFNFIYVFGNVV